MPDTTPCPECGGSGSVPADDPFPVVIGRHLDHQSPWAGGVSALGGSQYGTLAQTDQYDEPIYRVAWTRCGLCRGRGRVVLTPEVAAVFGLEI